jgi:hypothetical protein
VIAMDADERGTYIMAAHGDYDASPMNATLGR